ncbi:inositol metabolism protein Opi10 [Pseudohyphozyma bogoriensis]|nr:inositol metabolism protein Opi10 [Pseudohyphozyma bogoriensis]
MFGYLVPSRLPGQLTQIPESPERFSALIPDAGDLNHLSVFLTGAAPFPEGYGCTIHLELPGKGWSLIGGLSNSKPSAIFRLRGTLIPSTTTFASSQPANSTTATLGILCEPLASVEAQVSQIPLNKSTDASGATSNALVLARGGPAGGGEVELARKVGMSLYNAIAGYAVDAPQGGSWVEMGVVEKWYKNFERKLKMGGIGFLLSQD